MEILNGHGLLGREDGLYAYREAPGFAGSLRGC